MTAQTPTESSAPDSRDGGIENTLAAFGDPSQASVEVLTRFMETMEPVQPVSPGTSFQPFLNEAGLLDIYSVGTGSEVFRLRRQVDGNAAYDVKDLGIVARMPSIFAGLAGPDTPDIMGVDLEGKLTLSRWSAETESYQQEVEQPADAQGKIGQFLSTKVGDTIYANVLLDDATVGSNFLQGGEWESRRWVPVKTPDGNSDAKALAIAMCHNNPLQNALYAISEERSVWFADSRNAFTRFTDLGFLKVDDISVIQDSEDLLNIFAIGRRADRPNDPTAIWVKRQNKHPSEPGHIEWEDWQVVAEGVAFRELRSTRESNGAVSVFGIEDDEAGRLFIVREQRNSRGRRTGWGQLVALGNPVPGALFEIAQDVNGLAEAYSVARGTGVAGDAASQALETVMYRFWQDPETTQWFSEPVRIEESTEAVSLPTFAVEMQVKDADGTPVPFADLTLTSSVLATFRVNGRSFPVSRLRALPVEADAAGKAVVYYVTGALAAPTLGVQLAGTDADEGLTIEPNANLQDRLYSLTTDEVLAAKRTDGQPLLPGSGTERQQNAEAIAQISRRAMSIGRPAPSSGIAGQVPFLAGNRSLTGLRFHPRFRTSDPFALRLAEVPEQHWRVRFDGDRVHYQELDRAGAQVHVAALSASGVDGGFLGIDWGDIWQSVKSGVGAIFEGLKEFIVTTIIDPVTRLVKEIKVVFQLVVGGVKYLIDKTIHFIQQAFDIIEGVWNKVKVFFEELYQWLAFLFNLADLRRTAAVVRHSVNVSMDFADIAIDNIKQTVTSGLDGIEERIKSSVDQFVESLAPNESYKQFMDKHQDASGRDQANDTDGHNVVLNAFRDNYPGASGDDAFAMLKADDGPVQQILDQLQALGDNFEFGEGAQAFEEGVAYFSEIGSDPSNAVNLAFAGMVKLLESLALTGIALARGVLLTILDLISALLQSVRQAANARFEIPILSPIYKFFTGHALTFSMIDLTALIVAIPANIAYKIATGDAPFPNQASVDRFRQDVTAKRLAQLAGFKVGGQTMAKVSRRARAAVSTYAKVAGWILGGVFLVRAITEPLANFLVGSKQVSGGSGAPIPGKIGNLINKFSMYSNFAHRTIGLANVILRAVTSLFTAPWLLDSEAGKPGCTSGKKFGQIVWILQAAFGPFLGFIFWVGSLKTPRAATINLFRLTIWGFVHLVLVVIQAVLGGFANGLLIARAVLGTLAPQATWFLLYSKVITSTKGISLLVEAAFSTVTMVANGVLTFIATAKLESADRAMPDRRSMPTLALAAA